MHKFFIFIFLLMLHPGVSAQIHTAPDLNFSALIVSDIDTSLQWYSKVFKLDIVDQTSLPQRQLRMANLKNDQMKLELIEIGGSISQDSLNQYFAPRNRIQGFFKIGFTVVDFDDWVKSFKILDIRMDGQIVTDPVSGKRMIIVYDPDGNRIQFFEK